MKEPSKHKWTKGGGRAACKVCGVVKKTGVYATMYFRGGVLIAAQNEPDCIPTNDK